ncbi:MAG: hypothetical protein AB4080_10955 [Trichodesmium sp.]
MLIIVVEQLPKNTNHTHPDGMLRKNIAQQNAPLQQKNKKAKSRR